MQLSLSKRIIGVVILSVVIGSTSAVISSAVLMNGFTDLAHQEIEKLSSAVQAQMDNIRDKCEEAAYQFATRPDVVEAVGKGDSAYVQKIGKEFLKAGAVNVLTIANTEGKVIGRGHSDRVGDSVTN
jgi:methyl-accepting chemotaxis protein